MKVTGLISLSELVVPAKNTRPIILLTCTIWQTTFTPRSRTLCITCGFHYSSICYLVYMSIKVRPENNVAAMTLLKIHTSIETSGSHGY
jgi:hypothetical protein